MKSPSSFNRFSSVIAYIAGRPMTFVVAVLVILAWAVTGPFFDFSDTWQLIVNTGTTIVTFLMVFLIQNTQNRDTAAIQLKLDDLLVSIKDAHNELVEAEKLDEHELEEKRQEVLEIAKQVEEEVEEISDKLEQM